MVNRSLLLVMVAVSVLVWGSTLAVAQDDAAVAVDGGASLAEEDAPTGEAVGTDRPVAGIPGSSAGAEAASSTRQQPAQSPEELTERQLIALLAAEIDDLRGEVTRLKEELGKARESLTVLEEEVVALGGVTPMSAGDVLGAMSKDEDLRKSLGAATQGKLNFENLTGEEVLLFINGTRWRVLRNFSYIYVPVGKITFQRVGEAEPTFYDADEWKYDDGMMQTTYRLLK